MHCQHSPVSRCASVQGTVAPRAIRCEKSQPFILASHGTQKNAANNEWYVGRTAAHYRGLLEPQKSQRNCAAFVNRCFDQYSNLSYNRSHFSPQARGTVTAHEDQEL